MRDMVCSMWCGIRSDSGHAAQQGFLLAPDGGAAQKTVESAVALFEPPLQPAEMRLEFLVQHGGGCGAPIALGGDHLDQLAPPRHQRLSCAFLGVGQAPHGGADALGEQRQQSRIEPSVLAN